MASVKRRISLFGFSDTEPLLYPPHHVDHLPAGIHSILTRPTLFEDDFVAFAPTPDLFLPPKSPAESRDLLRQIYGDSELFWQVDGSDLVSPFSDDPDDDECMLSDDWDRSIAEAVLVELLKYGLWTLDQCFRQGRAGKQHIFAFLPLHKPEPYCSAALWERWLGLAYERGRTAGVETIHRTPALESSFLAEILDPAELFDDPEAFEAKLPLSYQLVNPLVNMEAIGPRVRRQEQASVIFPWEDKHRVMQEPNQRKRSEAPLSITFDPLLMSADGRDVIGAKYTWGQMDLYLLPEFPDISGKLNHIIRALFGFDEKSAEDERAELLRQVRPRIAFPEQRTARPLDGSIPGPKRGHGWLMDIDDRRIALPEREFLYLLAFIVAEKAGQATGIAPRNPRVGPKTIAGVFMPADGFHRREAGNPARPRQKLLKALARAGVDMSGKPPVVVSSGTQDYRYRLHDEYRAQDVSLQPLSRSENPVVKNLISLADERRGHGQTPVTQPKPAGWWAGCEPQVSDIYEGV